MKEKNILLAILAVLCVISFMITMVLSRSAKKPQSPQEMVSTAIDTMFTNQGIALGAVQQPYFSPSVQSRPIWTPLPSFSAVAGTNTIQAPTGSSVSNAGVWLPLDAKRTNPTALPQTQSIRAYRGAVR